MSPKKRRRSQVFPEMDEDIEGTAVVNEELSHHDHLEREREVWEAFREEHFEAVEQMPLTLHRQYALMRELEQQAHGYAANLLPTLQKYILLRREMASKRNPSALANLNGSCNIPTMVFPAERNDQFRGESAPLASPDLESTRGASSKLKDIVCDQTTTSTSLAGPQIEPSSTQQTPTLMGTPLECVRSPRTTWEMLSHMVRLTEELLRASNEKVNLAQAAHESVDRHARILDQAIREQESSISSGARPGHLAAVSLPDLVVPRWARPTRVPMSPIIDGDDKWLSSDGDEYLDSNSLRGNKYTRSPPETLKKRGVAGGRRRRKTGVEKHVQPYGQEKSLTITLPAQSGLGPVADIAEQTFCHCNQVSYGEMIGCDNAKCEREWFHLDCIGLAETPKGHWFCSPQCEISGRRRRK